MNKKEAVEAMLSAGTDPKEVLAGLASTLDYVAAKRDTAEISIKAIIRFANLITALAEHIQEQEESIENNQ